MKQLHFRRGDGQKLSELCFFAFTPISDRPTYTIDEGSWSYIGDGEVHACGGNLDAISAAQDDWETRLRLLREYY